MTPCSACHLLSRRFLARLILRPWRRRRYIPPKHRLNFNGLHGVISQKRVLFNIGTVHHKINTRHELALSLMYRMSEKSGTNGNFNYFSYFYLQVKRLKLALTLDERVKIVLLSGRQGWCMLLKSEIFVTLGRELQTVVPLPIPICRAKSAQTG
jgi:hypothetical protein